MLSGAGPGTMRWRWRAASPHGAVADPARTPRRGPGMSVPASLRAPAMRCGKRRPTDRQSAKLAWIAKTDPRLYRAYSKRYAMGFGQRTFGFRSLEAIIALAMLALGWHRPALPGRAA